MNSTIIMLYLIYLQQQDHWISIIQRFLFMVQLHQQFFIPYQNQLIQVKFF
jgi:hypothetical protein